MAKEGKKGTAILRVKNLSAIKKTEAEMLREILAKYGLDLSHPGSFEGTGPSTQAQECGTHSCGDYGEAPKDDRTRCSGEACSDQGCSNHICSSNSCDNNACSRQGCTVHEDSFASLYSQMSKESPALIALTAITRELNTKDWGAVSLTVE